MILTAINYRTQLPLGQIIARITQERGPFTELTEESLLKEIENSNRTTEEQTPDSRFDDGSIKDPENQTKNEENNEEEKQETYDQVRQELVQLISTAQNESALSQDFVSLLMSCLRPAAGTTSMSPLLKQHIPVGSLSADLSKPPVEEDDPMVAVGWKLQSLSHGSDLLKRAAKRLGGEALKEEKYWENVLSIVSRGEVLYKIRKGETRGLGIKYGYGDSGSEYHDPGECALRRNDDGSMSFQTAQKRTKVVRVNLYNVVNGERVYQGCSEVVDLIKKEQGVHDEIKNARNLLFEEELFYEMAKEARGLVSHRVRIVNGKIVIKLYDEVLEIEFVDPDGPNPVANMNLPGIVVDEEMPDVSAQSEYPKISNRANLMNAAFHILLCYAHRKNLETKASDPPPINTKESKTRSTLYILRPLIAHILHKKIMVRTVKTLELITQNIAGVSVQEAEVPAAPTDSHSNATGSTSAHLGKLAMHPMSKLVVESSLNGSKIEVVTRSPLQSYLPLYESFAYNNEGQEVSKGQFYELGELEEWTRWVLSEEK